MGDRVAACPKRMVFGPCGGVTSDGACEVRPLPCPFVEGAVDDIDASAVIRWDGQRLEPRPNRLDRFLVDYRPTFDPGTDDDAVAVLGERATILLGDHLDDPPELRAPAVAPRLVRAGARVIATVTARDRTRKRCAAAIERLVESGVVAVHCVTGDHPAVRFGKGAKADFHADSLELASMARSLGAYVSVAESPASPPTALRVERVVEKVAAGADVVVLNHSGGRSTVESFVAAARRKESGATVVAPVAVVTDQASAHALTQFPGLVVDPNVLSAVKSAQDGRTAGVQAAADLAARLLRTTCETVNLSGSAGDADLVKRCRIMADVMDEADRRLGP